MGNVKKGCSHEIFAGVTVARVKIGLNGYVRSLKLHGSTYQSFSWMVLVARNCLNYDYDLFYFDNFLPDFYKQGREL